MDRFEAFRAALKRGSTPMFKYNQRVIAKSGFYEGCTGKCVEFKPIEEYRDPLEQRQYSFESAKRHIPAYLVKLDICGTLKHIRESELETVLAEP